MSNATTSHQEHAMTTTITRTRSSFSGSTAPKLLPVARLGSDGPGDWWAWDEHGEPTVCTLPHLAQLPERIARHFRGDETALAAWRSGSTVTAFDNGDTEVAR